MSTPAAFTGFVKSGSGEQDREFSGRGGVSAGGVGAADVESAGSIGLGVGAGGVEGALCGGCGVRDSGG